MSSADLLDYEMSLLICKILGSKGPYTKDDLFKIMINIKQINREDLDKWVETLQNAGLVKATLLENIQALTLVGNLQTLHFDFALPEGMEIPNVKAINQECLYLMIKKYKEHGNSWMRNNDINSWIENKLTEELTELQQATTPEELQKECCDAINVLQMIWEFAERQKKLYAGLADITVGTPGANR